MAAFAPTLLFMYLVLWLTSPFRDKIMQVSAAFASISGMSALQPMRCCGLSSGLPARRLELSMLGA